MQRLVRILQLNLAGFLFAFLAAASGHAQQPAPWRDPSPHRVQFVTVEEDVQLEVLDWGGSGRPVVLLAGYDTAHIYDGFAEKLSAFCHVYGITRRGYGASSHPDSGYTAVRSGEDVLQVLDALGLKSPVLMGHSFGGQDLNTIGAMHPERIAGLVYLNSAEDPTLVMADYGVPQVNREKLPAEMRKLPAPDLSSFAAYRAWQLRTHGIQFPEAELRQLYAANPDGTVGKSLTSQSVRNAIFAGRQKPDYARIRVPVLAFFAGMLSLSEQIERYKPKDDQERSALEQQYAIDSAIRARHMQDLRKGVPGAQEVVMPGASYYIFLSNQEEIVRHLRAFLAELNRQNMV